MATEQRSAVKKEAEFTRYVKEIKEVRSLVNLWRDEFDRRNSLNLPAIQPPVLSDDNRTCGFS